MFERDKKFTNISSNNGRNVVFKICYNYSLPHFCKC